MIEPTHEEQVVAAAHSHGSIVRNDDGHYVYWPDKIIGAWYANDLRAIADELDRLDKPFRDALDEYHKDEGK